MAAASRNASSPAAAPLTGALTRLAGASERELVFARLLRAPPDLVWKAWTEPAMLSRWFAPGELTAAAYQAEPRPGGCFRLAMRSPEGVPYPHTGEYLEVAPPDRLVLRLDTDQLPDEWKAAYNQVRGTPERREAFSVVLTVTLEPRGRETYLTVRSLYDTATDAAANVAFGAVEGWAACLDKLEALGAEGAATDRELVLSRWIAAPRERVFTAYTDPAQVPRWWGPAGFTCQTEAIDIRPGGAWRFTMRGPDGTVWPNLIDYLEVLRPERLRLRLSSGAPGDAGFDVTVTFEERDGRTRLTQRMVCATAAICDEVKAFGASELGQTTIDKLEAFLAAA